MPGPTPLPDVSVEDIEPGVRRELRSLGREREERVTLHLASALAAIAQDDTGTAVAQAVEAVALAPRLGVVRETAGLVHYRAGEFTQALRELRTARRMGSGPELLPLMVDCERALGRPAQALELADQARTEDLDRPTQIELALVVAGTRRDLGDVPAGLRVLEVPELRSSAPASIRLRYAYADLLEAAERPDEALTWFTRVAQVDATGETDAAERVLSLQGLSIESADDDDDEDDQQQQDDQHPEDGQHPEDDPRGAGDRHEATGQLAGDAEADVPDSDDAARTDHGDDGAGGPRGGDGSGVPDDRGAAPGHD